MWWYYVRAVIGDGVLDLPVNIVDSAAKIPELDTLVQVLNSSAYSAVATLLENADAEYTIFAPNQGAFTKAGLNTSNGPLVTETLKLHVIKGTVFSTQLAPEQFPSSLATDKPYVNLGGKGQHLTILADASGVSVKAGGSLFASVVSANNIASNGVIHIINEVLALPESTAQVATTNNLTELVTLLQATKLVTEVTTTPSLTILAPTNMAFDNVDKKKVDSSAKLTRVLKYHVIAQELFTSDLTPGIIVWLGNCFLTAVAL